MLNRILKSVDKTNGFTCHAMVETLAAVDKIPCSGVGKDAVKGIVKIFSLRSF